MTRTSRLIAVIAVAVSIGALSSDASAAVTNGCTVASVQADQSANSAPRVTIVCSGSSFIANAGGPFPGGSCSAVSADLTKMWESIATSAFLAGKHLNILYTPANTSCNFNLISSLTIVN
jgi:hypothetical protein